MKMIKYYVKAMLMCGLLSQTSSTVQGSKSIPLDGDFFYAQVDYSPDDL